MEMDMDMDMGNSSLWSTPTSGFVRPSPYPTVFGLGALLIRWHFLYFSQMRLR